MHHRMIDPDKNKLFDCAADPEQWYTTEEKIAKGGSQQCIRKNETGSGNEEKKKDQTDIGYLHNSLVVRLKFLEIILPSEELPESCMKQSKAKRMKPT